jgi:CBS domain containing-hemolysin-like protein
MNAASIIEAFGRGIPATLDTSMIVDVCAYLRSTQSPAVLVLNSRGETRGVLSHRDIIHASGRLGSSVMQMMAQ